MGAGREAGSADIVARIGGRRAVTGAHRPFVMDRPDCVVLVERGHLDVFAVALEGNEPSGRRRFVARVPAGEMAFGAHRVKSAGAGDGTLGLVAVPSQDAVLIEGTRAGLESERFDLDATRWVDEWVTRLAESLAGERAPPRDAELLEANPEVPYRARAALTAQHLDVIWITATATMRSVGRTGDKVEPGDPPHPITERTWVTLEADTTVTGCYTPTAMVRGELWRALDRFAERAIAHAAGREAQQREALAVSRRARSAAQAGALAHATHRLAGVLGESRRTPGRSRKGEATLEAAVWRAAEALGTVNGGAAGPPARRGTIEEIAHAWGLRTRRVRLRGEWWRENGATLIGRTRPGGAPVVLHSDGSGRYRAVEPVTGTAARMTRAGAEAIESTAWALYPGLPERIDGRGTVVRFALEGLGGELGRLGAVGVAGGLAGLVAPVLIGEILVRIIPRAEMALWTAALAALVAVACTRTVLDLVRGWTVLRIEGRVEERLQSAIWSRLIGLPAPFFTAHSVGELAERANAISTAREVLTGAAVQAALGAVFAGASAALLFVYSPGLALAACAAIGAWGAAGWVLARHQLRAQRQAFAAQGRVSGLVFQMLAGVAKIRVAHAESEALARWAECYAEQRTHRLRALGWATAQSVLGAACAPLVLVAVFALTYAGLDADGVPVMGLAAFVTFNAALAQLIGAISVLTTAATTLVNVVPLIERLDPILAAVPERAEGGTDPGDLRGEIELANVTFRYGPEAPNVIDGVSLRIAPGEYVAVVGGSGAGKSTLYRLLLGFERPTSGAVLLDGHDLGSLDIRAVRSRFGVVLQHGQVIAGSIYENIAGMAPLSSEEAWAAARAAALDEDIEAMPMGMRTMLPEGGVGLSVGQKQRLLIARAMARKPRVMLFDEATSALDNRAQTIVQSALRRLGVTRVVIAHRLSAIKDVDRIVVMEQGRIVESGRYDELIGQKGPFAALAKRQVA